jgi:hypothetical protein
MRIRVPRLEIRKSARYIELSQEISRGNERKALKNLQKKQFHKSTNEDI